MGTTFWKTKNIIFTFVLALEVSFAIIWLYVMTGGGWTLSSGRDFYFFYYAFQMVWNHNPPSDLYNHIYQLQAVRALGLHDFSPIMFYGYPDILHFVFSPFADFAIDQS